VEKTFVMIKPDGVQRGLVGEIIARFERKGLKLVAMKMVHVDEAFARKHYEVHQGKPFFEGLVKYITSSPVIAMVWEGKNAIQVVRDMVGATDPQKAAPGTIRGDYGMDIGRNLIHASDGPKTAAFEIGLWFKDEEITTWERVAEPWLYE